MLDIITLDPGWTQEQVALATALARGAAAGSDAEAASVWFLLRQDPDAWASTEAQGCYYWPTGTAAEVEWAHLARRVADLNRLSADTRAAVRLACSLADTRVLMNYGSCIGAMSAANRDHFITALGHMPAGVR